MPRCAEFHTQKLAGQKASPGGEAVATSVATDEVEAKNYRHESVQTCYLRPHPVRLEPDHHSRGMTATGSHIDFGFAARSTTLQGKAFLCPGRLCVDFCRSNVGSWRAGHAAAPTFMNDSPYRPSSGRNCDSGHLPPGEGFFTILSASAPIYHAQSLQLRPYKIPPSFSLLYHPIFFPAS